MAKQKFYAVKVGRTPGIYLTWDDCKSQVDKFENAEYKSFGKLDEAYEWMSSEKSDDAQKDNSVPLPNGPYTFVDGSFNAATGVYGYGGFLCVHGRKYPLEGSGKDPELATMRNVAGELEGSMAAVRKAEELGLREITMLYDYKGIEEWAVGRWKTEKAGTSAYREFMSDSNRSVKVSFQKVPAHTGIEGNEMADVMAKHAVGMSLTKKQKSLYDQVYAIADRDGYDVSEPVSTEEREIQL